MAELHVSFSTVRPAAVRIFVIEHARRTPAEPPATSMLGGTRAPTVVVISVSSAEKLSVGDPVLLPCRPHGIIAVSAVPVHGQLIVTSLITD